MSDNKYKLCDRCGKTKLKKDFHPSFGVCKTCVVEKDYDSVQSDLGIALRGLDKYEKQSMLRDILYEFKHTRAAK